MSFYSNNVKYCKECDKPYQGPGYFCSGNCSRNHGSNNQRPSAPATLQMHWHMPSQSSSSQPSFPPVQQIPKYMPPTAAVQQPDLKIKIRGIVDSRTGEITVMDPRLTVRSHPPQVSSGPLIMCQLPYCTNYAKSDCHGYCSHVHGMKHHNGF